MSKQRGAEKTCGVGTNDSEYPVSEYDCHMEGGKQVCKLLWTCPLYQVWSSMLKRCYGANRHIKHPTYESCSVCDEWLLFSNFRAWMIEQDWEGKQLDKDILGCGNLYSPENCTFVSRSVNLFLNTHGRRNRELPTGVTLHKNGKYIAQIHVVTGGQIYLGSFNSSREAHDAWFLEKQRQCLALIEKEQLNPVVGKALFSKTLQLYQGTGKEFQA